MSYEVDSDSQSDSASEDHDAHGLIRASDLALPCPRVATRPRGWLLPARGRDEEGGRRFRSGGKKARKGGKNNAEQGRSNSSSCSTDQARSETNRSATRRKNSSTCESTSKMLRRTRVGRQNAGASSHPLRSAICSPKSSNPRIREVFQLAWAKTRSPTKYFNVAWRTSRGAPIFTWCVKIALWNCSPFFAVSCFAFCFEMAACLLVGRTCGSAVTRSAPSKIRDVVTTRPALSSLLVTSGHAVVWAREEQTGHPSQGCESNSTSKAPSRYWRPRRLVGSVVGAWGWVQVWRDPVPRDS